MEYVIIYTTVPNEEEGKNLSEILVSERLAACVDMLLIASTHRWKGRVQRGEEYGLFIKTSEDVADRAMERIRELHSYEVPCILRIPIEGGYEEYLKWIGESTG